MDKVFTWCTPAEAVRAEGEYWKSVSVEERVSAVETLREVTIGIYDETPARLERVYRLVERPWGALPDRGRARRGGPR